MRALFYLYCFWESKHKDTQGYRRQDVVWGGVGTANLALLYPLNYSLIMLYSSFAISESRFSNILYCSKAETLSFKKI